MEFTITENIVKPEEKQLFSQCLQKYELDDAIWGVYNSSLLSSSKMSKPHILRAYDNDNLAGILFYIVCYGTGKTLFKNRVLAALTDRMKIPVYLWMRQAICADILSNHGFVADGYDERVIKEMLEYLRNSTPCFFVIDLIENERVHEESIRFPYTKEGAISLEGMKNIDDYLKGHKNLGRKIRKFAKDGGTVTIRKGKLDEETQLIIKKCVLATTEKSVIRAPFQDLFPSLILQTCNLESDRMIHFIAEINGQFLGYHTYIQTGAGLRMIHGAFDRTLETTLHSYENIITATAEYAIEEGLEIVYFGPVFNETKNRLMNKTYETNVYLYCNNPIYRKILPILYSKSSMQAEQLLKYS